MSIKLTALWWEHALDMEPWFPLWRALRSFCTPGTSQCGDGGSYGSCTELQLWRCHWGRNRQLNFCKPKERYESYCPWPPPPPHRTGSAASAISTKTASDAICKWREFFHYAILQEHFKCFTTPEHFSLPLTSNLNAILLNINGSNTLMNSLEWFKLKLNCDRSD